MDAKEAKEYFECENSHCSAFSDITNVTKTFMIGEAIKALEKQIPKKPVGTEAAFPYNIFTAQKCANCGNPIIGNKIYKYCPECGQKIDWGGDN